MHGALGSVVACAAAGRVAGHLLTLHLWTQIVGKIRMTMSPPLNHWWHATLYVNSRGLDTSPIPYGDGAFEIQFDFLKHRLEISTSGGPSATAAGSHTGGGFYAR